MVNDIRWEQRFSNYCKVLNQLKKFIDKQELNELEEQGLVKSFEYSYELAWNVMKDFFEYQGEDSIRGSRDAIRLAFARGLIEDGKTWMDMIESRMKTSHTYNEEIVDEIKDKILSQYYELFLLFKDKMESTKNSNS